MASKLEETAFLLAMMGYSQEVDCIVGMSKSLMWDTLLWDFHGPNSKRLCGAVLDGNEKRINFLLDHGAKPTERDLLNAVRRDNLDLVERLVKAEVPATPEILMEAVEKNHPEMMEAFVKTAPSLNTRDRRDFTPLMRAVELGQKETVEILLKAGANPNVVQRYGIHLLTLPYTVETIANYPVRTALDYAATYVDKKMVRIYWLLRHKEGLHGGEISRLAQQGQLTMG